MPLNKVTVETILKEKPSPVHCMNEDTAVSAAVSEMNRLRIDCLMVQGQVQGEVQGEVRVVGVFTERDVLVRVLAETRDPHTTLIREVMTKDFQWISRETSVEDAMQRMTEKRVRHLPVFDGEKLVGMISIGDVTRWLLKVNEMEAENLRRYIFSEYPG